MMELKEKADERALRLPLRKAIRSETLLMMSELKCIEAFAGVRLEGFDDFVGSEMVPVPREERFHHQPPIVCEGASVPCRGTAAANAPFLAPSRNLELGTAGPQHAT